MTRRDQTIRAWIERDTPADHWRSMVSHKGKVHQKSTNTRLRKAAIDFNRLHTIAILKPPVIPDTSIHHQTDLL